MRRYSRKRVTVILLYAIICVLGVACGPGRQESEVFLESSLVTDTIPSASGMAYVNDTVYVVGDDSPFLFLLSPDFTPIGKHLLLQGYPDKLRIPKKIKPDFECIAEWSRDGQTSLLVFGSGSKAETRDSLAVVHLSHLDNPETYSLTKFYEYLLDDIGEGRDMLNIEGAVVHNDSLHLFNRANNQIYIFEMESFYAFLQGTDTVVDIHTVQVTLPEVRGVQAGFSGAAVIPEIDYILFSASLEAADDWIADGAVLGSYVGMLNAQKPEEVISLSPVTDKDGRIYYDKVESLAFHDYLDTGDGKVLAVVDNDDGTSKFLELLIKEGFLNK
ncbi:hypothetical protein RCC89_16305 [Cytophagaceae bacterium ABcell3]|nr:hypothetical protein RCC89_16305 [Cytophagaceae bacterium ABcell3]